MPQADPQPNPDDAVSSDGVQRRTTFRDWFRRKMKRSRNQTPDQIPLEDSSRNQISHPVPSEDFGRNRMPGQMSSEDPSRHRTPDHIPSEDPPQIDTPQARTPPLNNKSLTLAPGQRIRVSAPLLFLFYGTDI